MHGKPKIKTFCCSAAGSLAIFSFSSLHFAAFLSSAACCSWDKKSSDACQSRRTQRTSSFFSFSVSALRLLSSSSLTFLSLILVSGQRWMVWRESMNEKIAETRSAVSSTRLGRVRLRMTCFWHLLRGRGLSGR